MRKTLLSRAIAALVLVPCAVFAQTASPGAGADEQPRDLENIVVQGEIMYRDRAADIAPTLSYDLEYFQRFEPLTVGDMLKRVPSVAFVSDVLEFDGARLRGLSPGYTQILINGKHVPGAGEDRSFFIDRIPAELVERIEIVRSQSANRSGDAMAGALNIVLRDSISFEGAYLRAGALAFDDDEVKGTFGAVASGDFAGGRLLGGVNVQGRHNPKEKRSDRYEEPGGDFTDAELQSDVRDGTDYSANASWAKEVGNGDLEFDAMYVHTDRDETEQSFEYNDQVSTSRDHLLSTADQFEDISQDNWTLNGSYHLLMAGGTTIFALGFADFDEDTVSTEEESSYDDEDTPPSFDETEGQQTLIDIQDQEYSAKLAHERVVGGGLELEFGVDLQWKDRDFTQAISESGTDEEGSPLPPFGDFEEEASAIEESRIDPYVMLSGGSDRFEWEAGLRYEDTDVDIDTDESSVENDYGELLPSAHARWNLDANHRINGSVARTVRRPDFNFILPVTLEEEYADNDFVGNPALDPETALGFDLGYEMQLGTQGVVGVNFFYRDVSDLIELVNTGEPSATAIGDFEDELEEFLEENPDALPGDPGYPEFEPDSYVFSADNVGDGEVYGVEFDLSTPLGVIGLPDTGIFVNYSWLDSEVRDFAGKRRFNGQADYVYNLGFIHDIPGVGFSFGASYRKQGEAFDRLLGEEVVTKYDADLEAFIEKRFGKRLALRLTGSNLLDASKDEFFETFSTLDDQLDRDYDEFETESENAGRVIQFVARYSF